MLQKLKKFFSAEAFEQRARDRERRYLVRELEDLDAARRYIRGRTGVLLARMNVLNREDCSATLRSMSERSDQFFALAQALTPAAASFAAFGHALGAVSTRAAVRAEAELVRLDVWKSRILAALAGLAALCFLGTFAW